MIVLVAAVLTGDAAANTPGTLHDDFLELYKGNDVMVIFFKGTLS